MNTRIVARFGPFRVGVSHYEFDGPRPDLFRVGWWVRERITYLADSSAVYADASVFAYRRLVIAVATGARRSHGVAIDVPDWFPWPHPTAPTVVSHAAKENL